MPKKVIVLGAGGNLGRRLIARGLVRGHSVTALVRDASKFRVVNAGILPQTIVECDVNNGTALSAAIAGHDVVINAAGNVADGDSFVALFGSVVAATEAALPPPARLWLLAGAAVLTLPNANRIGVGLPFVPEMYRPHEVNWRRLASSSANWSLMCPGPMIPAPGGEPRSDLRVSIDVVPYPVGRWAVWAPGIALSLLMKSKLPEMTVSYEDVADLIMTNLEPERFSRRRVGIALPAGSRATKDNWTLGQRGGDS